mmetsp:Transcript_8417/g.25292  ORF Transcript_8417/g.25292 Transcript_8417/m.25292 type:complete len:297 (+) Transcript_8417:599-1489(+)
MGSSHSGPSRQPHWKPCTMESLAAPSRRLSTSDGSVSSRSTFAQPAPDGGAPTASGPKAQMLRAASRSQSYASWKCWPRRFLDQPARTSPRSRSSATPLSSGSAIMVSLLRRFGVSEKHLSDEVSTTVSQKATTGSATLISTDEYISRRSCMMQSRYSSPVPRITCSPDSSTRVRASGYDLLILRRPSVIFGSSAGLSGSTASLMTAASSNLKVSKMEASSSSSAASTMVAVLAMCAPTPSSSTQLPGPAWLTSVRWRPWHTDTPATTQGRASSGSSGVYASPSTRTRSPGLTLPE